MKANYLIILILLFVQNTYSQSGGIVQIRASTSLEEIEDVIGFDLPSDDFDGLELSASELQNSVDLKSYLVGRATIKNQSESGIQSTRKIVNAKVGDNSALIVQYQLNANASGLENIMDFDFSILNSTMNSAAQEELTRFLKMQTEIELINLKSPTRVLEAVKRGIDAYLALSDSNSDTAYDTAPSEDLSKEYGEEVSQNGSNIGKQFVTASGHIIRLDLDNRNSYICFANQFINYSGGLPIATVRWFKTKIDDKVVRYVSVRKKSNHEYALGYAYFDAEQKKWTYFNNTHPNLEVGNAELGFVRDLCGSYTRVKTIFTEVGEDVSGKFQGSKLTHEELISKCRKLVVGFNPNNIFDIQVSSSGGIAPQNLLSEDMTYRIPCPSVITETILDAASQGGGLKSSTFNPFGWGGFLINVKDLGYFYYLFDGENEKEVMYKYNHNSGDLEFFEPEEYTPLEHFYFSINKAGNIHLLLGAAGFTGIPIISQVADIADGFFYILDGKPGEASLSMLSAIPLVGILKGGKFVDEIAAIGVVSRNGELLDMTSKLKNLATQFNLSPKHGKEFIEFLNDLKSQNKLYDFLNDSKKADVWILLKQSNDVKVQQWIDDPAIFNKLVSDLKENPKILDFINEGSGKTASGLHVWKLMTDANIPSCF